MSLELGEIIRGAFVPRGFQALLPDNLDAADKRLARKQRMTRATVFILGVGESRPTPYEVLGMLYFAQIVKTADNAIDRNYTAFSTPDQLRQFLLDREMNGMPGVTVNQSLEKCLDCYSPNKQRVVSAFFDEMVKVHFDQPQRGIPGAY